MLALLRLARPFLPWIGGILALVALAVWVDHRGYQRGERSRDGEVATLTTSIANLKAASAQAAAQNLADVRAVEARQAAITKEQTDALSKQLADARSIARAYVLRQQAAGGASDAGSGRLPVAAPAAEPVAPAAKAVVVAASDIEACTDSFVIASEWQAWWRKVSGE